jgi:hypothetical protein
MSKKEDLRNMLRFYRKSRTQAHLGMNQLRVIITKNAFARTLVIRHPDDYLGFQCTW